MHVVVVVTEFGGGSIDLLFLECSVLTIAFASTLISHRIRYCSGDTYSSASQYVCASFPVRPILCPASRANTGTVVVADFQRATE